jgi:dienelactone hydrolase
MLFNISGKSQVKTIQLMAPDKVVITADLYIPKPDNTTFIILFHQAKYSRGEYIEVAPKLNALGYNCMAVDLRSGEEINGIENLTFRYADSLKKETRYTDAYSDMRTALSYIKNKYPTAKIILFGSGYSASLSLKLAGDNPAGISGVIAFSPGEYFSAFGWNRDIIQTSSSHIKCPVFITSAKSEEDQWRKIYDAIPLQTKVSFLPTQDGKNGAKVLWSAFPESEEYWMALKSFLAKYYPKGR